MGISTHVMGFKPPDAKWLAMKAVWDACDAANIKTPEDVIKFFGGESPDPAGVDVSEEALVDAGAVQEWQDDYRQGFEIVVANIPKDVARIRVYNSW